MQAINDITLLPLLYDNHTFLPGYRFLRILKFSCKTRRSIFLSDYLPTQRFQQFLHLLWVSLQELWGFQYNTATLAGIKFYQGNTFSCYFHTEEFVIHNLESIITVLLSTCAALLDLLTVTASCMCILPVRGSAPQSFALTSNATIEEQI